MKFISTDRAGPPLGHYSQAVQHGGVIYVSTQLGIAPGEPSGPPPGVEAQTGTILHNVREILRAAGSDLTQVIKVTIYVSDIAHWDAVNRVYGEWFGDHKPARGVIPVGKLHRGCDVAFEVIAAAPETAG